MARAPREPPPIPGPPPPRLVRFRVTEPELAVILRALRTTTSGAVEARRLADVLAEEAALSDASRMKVDSRGPAFAAAGHTARASVKRGRSALSTGLVVVPGL
jgi:hypothetical protein